MQKIIQKIKIPELCVSWTVYSINDDILTCTGFRDGTGKLCNWLEEFTERGYDFSNYSNFDISTIRGVIGFDDWDEVIDPPDELMNDYNRFDIFFIAGKYRNGEQCILKLLISKEYDRYSR
jgi:hypothetical protein